MGPDETATATTGGLEKLTFFTGTGRHRAQISYFFRMQNGSRTPFRVDLVMGSRLHRVRRRLWVPEGSESKTWRISAQARNWLSTSTDMSLPMEVPAHAA